MLRTEEARSAVGQEQVVFVVGREEKETPPPLLKGIGRIFMVTKNLRKLSAITSRIWPYSPCWGNEETIPVIARESSDREPDWTSAVRVAQSKVESLVRDVKGEPGPQALFIGSDIVVFINGEPYRNLSRNGHLTGTDLEKEIINLQRIFSKPTNVSWDVALAMSRKGTDVVSGNRIIAHYSPIPGELVKEIFEDDIAGALGRNTRLPLIDDSRLQKYIVGIDAMPIKNVLGPNGYPEPWHHLCTPGESGEIDPYQIEKCISAIVGGAPFPEQLESMLYFSKIHTQEWQIV